MVTSVKGESKSNIDLETPDTTPGSGGWAAPDEEVDDYREWMRGMWRLKGSGVRQYIGVIVYRGLRVEPRGPYASELMDVIDKARTRYGEADHKKTG